MKFTKHLALAGAAAILAAGVYGTANAADAWRHGVVRAKADSGISFMPTKFDDKFGIDLSMMEFASSTVPVKALISGEIDSYATTPLTGMAAMSHGAKLKFIGCDWPGMTYDLYATKKIGSLQDLVGKKVGISGPGGAPDLFIREALRSADIDPKGVTFVSVGGGGDRIRALVAGLVDATATSSEFEQDAAERGITVLARAVEATPHILRICIVTTDDIIENRHDELVRFLATQMVGYQYAMDNPEETYKLAKEKAGLKDDDTSPQFIYEEAVKYNAVTPNLEMDADRLQWNADMLLRNGRIKQKLDISKFIDGEPREEALKLVEKMKNK